MLTKLSTVILTFSILTSVFTTSILAQSEPTVTLPNATIEIVEITAIPATDSADATAAATLATPSAEVKKEIQEKIDRDITETVGLQTNRLLAYMRENPPTPMSWNNFI